MVRGNTLAYLSYMLAIRACSLSFIWLKEANVRSLLKEIIFNRCIYIPADPIVSKSYRIKIHFVVLITNFILFSFLKLVETL